MKTFKRILVPIDFSPCSEVVLGHAAEIAPYFGAMVDVLHVWEPPMMVVPETSVGFVDRDARRALLEFAHTRQGTAMKTMLTVLEERGVEQVRGRLERVDPCETILRIAHESPYDLIVMGTHGRTGLAHLFLGSIAERVVRRAPCPVLTIRVADLPHHDGVTRPDRSARYHVQPS